MKQALYTLILFSFFTLPLGACGIKPNSVDAPQGVEPDTFPRTYPSK